MYYAIQESNSINRAHLKYFGAGMDDIEKNAAKMQLEGLLDTLTDAKEYGSILNVESVQLGAAAPVCGSRRYRRSDQYGQRGAWKKPAEQLNGFIDIGETMARKYWVTVTNPPYLNAKNLQQNVVSYINDYFPLTKNDFFTVFIEKGLDYLIPNGLISMITQQAWMFQIEL